MVKYYIIYFLIIEIFHEFLLLGGESNGHGLTVREVVRRAIDR